MTWTEACRIGPALVARYCPNGTSQLPAIDVDQLIKAKHVLHQQGYRRKRRMVGKPGWHRGYRLEPGEHPINAWVQLEAARDGVRPHTIYQRVYRGSYPDHKFRRINKRVVFVTPPSV